MTAGNVLTIVLLTLLISGAAAILFPISDGDEREEL